MVKLLKKVSLKKMGKSFRSRSKSLRKSKSKKPLVAPEEPSLSVVAPAVKEVPAGISFTSNKEVAAVANDDGMDPPPQDSPPTERGAVVIDNVQDVAEKTNDAAEEATNMSIASASKHSESNMSVSSAEVDVIEEAPKEEEVVVEEVAQAKEEAVSPVEAVPEAEATAAVVDEEEVEEEEEKADADGEKGNLEPNIEIVQQDDKVAIGFYQPPAVIEGEEAEVEEAEEYGVVAHTLEQTLEFGAQTFEIGAQLMDQYFSCFPCQDVATPEQATTEDFNKDTLVDTTEAKKQTVHVIENTDGSVAIEMDDRNENPAADMNEEAHQEIRVM